MAVVMPKAVYVFELKCLQETGDRQKAIGNRGRLLGNRQKALADRKRVKVLSAIEQLRVKGYAEKYRALNRPIYLIGIDFDRKKRNIVDFKWEEG